MHKAYSRNTGEEAKFDESVDIEINPDGDGGVFFQVKDRTHDRSTVMHWPPAKARQIIDALEQTLAQKEENP